MQDTARDKSNTLPREEKGIKILTPFLGKEVYWKPQFGWAAGIENQGTAMYHISPGTTNKDAVPILENLIGVKFGQQDLRLNLKAVKSHRVFVIIPYKTRNLGGYRLFAPNILDLRLVENEQPIAELIK